MAPGASWGALALLALQTAACNAGPDLDSKYAGPPPATCTASVGGRWVDVETDYLPRVVACENGGADFEALKAQAVAARSYLYYQIQRQGWIGDGTGDQVYTCANPPLDQHVRAVQETSGQVLRYGGVQVAGFFVAGALPEEPGCYGGPIDPKLTEQYVTYNQGLRGDQVQPSSIGLAVPANRGCMSQNGSDCLSRAGLSYRDILRFYYGDDVAIVQAQGACVQPLQPAPPVPTPPADECTGVSDTGDWVTVSGGESSCGADFQIYDCVNGTFQPTGVPCGNPGVCCTDPVDLLCGQAICLDGQVEKCVGPDLLVPTSQACGG